MELQLFKVAEDWAPYRHIDKEEQLLKVLSAFSVKDYASGWWKKKKKQIVCLG